MSDSLPSPSYPTNGRTRADYYNPDIDGIRRLSDSHACRHCGLAKSAHAGERNPAGAYRCPGSRVEPSWPSEVEDARGIQAARDEYARRLDWFWNIRATAFAPVR